METLKPPEFHQIRQIEMRLCRIGRIRQKSARNWESARNILCPPDDFQIIKNRHLATLTCKSAMPHRLRRRVRLLFLSLITSSTGRWRWKGLLFCTEAKKLTLNQETANEAEMKYAARSIMGFIKGLRVQTARRRCTESIPDSMLATSFSHNNCYISPRGQEMHNSRGPPPPFFFPHPRCTSDAHVAQSHSPPAQSHSPPIPNTNPTGGLCLFFCWIPWFIPSSANLGVWSPPAAPSVPALAKKERIVLSVSSAAESRSRLQRQLGVSVDVVLARITNRQNGRGTAMDRQRRRYRQRSCRTRATVAAPSERQEKQ
jgi:hypothetical protein